MSLSPKKLLEGREAAQKLTHIPPPETVISVNPSYREIPTEQPVQPHRNQLSLGLKYAWAIGITWLAVYGVADNMKVDIKSFEIKQASILKELRENQQILSDNNDVLKDGMTKYVDLNNEHIKDHDERLKRVETLLQIILNPRKNNE